ncbi:MAG: hypothetical protein R2867_28925 [Caldilineaceae bacterium]
MAGLLVWFEEVANVVWSTFNSASANKTAAWLLTIYQVLQSLAIVGPALLGIKSLGFYVVAQTIAALIGTLFAVHRLRVSFLCRGLGGYRLYLSELWCVCTYWGCRWSMVGPMWRLLRSGSAMLPLAFIRRLCRW